VWVTRSVCRVCAGSELPFASMKDYFIEIKTKYKKG